VFFKESFIELHVSQFIHVCELFLHDLFLLLHSSRHFSPARAFSQPLLPHLPSPISAVRSLALDVSTPRENIQFASVARRDCAEILIGPFGFTSVGAKTTGRRNKKRKINGDN